MLRRSVVDAIGSFGARDRQPPLTHPKGGIVAENSFLVGPSHLSDGYSWPCTIARDLSVVRPRFLTTGSPVFAARLHVCARARSTEVGFPSRVDPSDEGAQAVEDAIRMTEAPRTLVDAFEDELPIGPLGPAPSQAAAFFSASGQLVSNGGV